MRDHRSVRHLHLVRLMVLILSVLLAALPAAAAQRLSATVLRVIDGDTIEVRLGSRQETVRLLGIDTPETKHPTVGVEPYGPEAEAFTKKLLPPGQRVELELDVQERDRYGRLLAYVYLPDGRMVNALLLQEGLAQLYTVSPNVKHVEQFRRLQQEAREAGRGLWAPVKQAQQQRIVRLEVDRVAEVVRITNLTDQTLDLSGWTLVSVTGNQRFTFPAGTKLAPGKTLAVVSGPRAQAGPGVLVWTRSYVWNNQGDAAELWNLTGDLVVYHN